MAILIDIVGLLIGVAISLFLMGLIIYAPFWLLKTCVAWFRKPKFSGIRMETSSPPKSSFSVECDKRYERARHAVRDVFRQEDPGPRFALMFEPDNWRAFCAEPWSVSGFDTPFVFVSPIAVQAMDISRRRCTCGMLDGIREEEGGSWESPERDMLPGSRFIIRSISAGAICAGPGIRIAMRAIGKGNIGYPQSREDTPCLCVRFMLAIFTDTILSPPVDGKPEWKLDDTFFTETGVMDFAGEIPYTAQIVLFRGGDLTDYSNMTPLSNVAVGVINVTSPNISL